MAFKKENWGVKSSHAKRLKGAFGGNAGDLLGVPNEYIYCTSDASEALDTSGYFNDVSSQLKVGDVIYFYSEWHDATNHERGLLIVKSNSGGVVDTYDKVVYGNTATDTD